MRPWIPLSLLAVAFLFVSEASAQHRHPRNSPTTVHVDRVPNRHALRDDREDLRRIKDISQSWHRAVRRGRPRAEAKADRRLHRWLHREIEESRYELARSRAIVREVRFERAAYGRGGRWGYQTLRVEHAQLNEERRDLDRMQALARELHYLRHARGRRYYAQKSAILDELVRLARREVRRQTDGPRPVRREYAWR